MSMVKINSYKLVIFGMNGVFSLIPFEILLEAGAEILAIILPRETADDLGPRWLPKQTPIVSELPIITAAIKKNIQSVAFEKQIPIMTVGNLRDEKTLFEISKLEPDLIITLCFPRIFLNKLLSIPKHGCLNLHPSLLPAYRGPEPLFWQFRAGETKTGVSLHIMDEKMDTGDIVIQRKVEFPEGIRANEADEITAKVGGELIIEALSKPEIEKISQKLESASYQGFPKELDRTISMNWPVKRAFNFLRGADEWAPFWIETEDEEKLEINQVIEYQFNKKQPHHVIHHDGAISVQLKDGLLRFR